MNMTQIKDVNGFRVKKKMVKSKYENGIKKKMVQIKDENGIE